MTKIVAFSDTHGQHWALRGKWKIPDGDILIFAGDYTAGDIGKYSVREWLKWLDSQPFEHKIFVSGNHDGAAQKWPREFWDMVKEFPSVTYLEDEEVTIQGLTFWGCPWTPTFFNWHFMATEDEIAEKLKPVPENIDVLITHGPPDSVLDKNDGGVHCGSTALMDRISRVHPLVHIFGHIHQQEFAPVRATYRNGEFWTTFCNVGVLDEEYKLVRGPMEIEI
jgi:Icc-related predicted phosphoesterase